MRAILFSFCLTTLALPLAAQTLPAPYAEAIETLKAVRKEGHGNEAAAAAWKEVVQGDSQLVVPLLQAMSDANGLAANWLVSAAQAVADRELAHDRPLPLDAIGAFLMDTRQAPNGRRMAFDLIQRVDPETAAKLVPGMLNDPCAALRRGAVAGLLEDARGLVQRDKKLAATIVYRQALGAARDVDQIDEVAKALRDLGQSVDLPKHFGFLTHWSVIGPFDNTGRKGFDTVYPPERDIDLQALYRGKGTQVTWSSLTSSKDYGMIDINKPYGELKEVLAYAYTDYESPNDRPAEIRLGCKNAWKIWLNGELVFGRDEYHRGMRIDQYRLPISLTKGKNTLLIKVCQNEQREDWTVQWQFQLRVCDSTGTALLASNRLPTPVKSGRRKRADDS